KGALPPNSMEVFLTVPAHCWIRVLPTPVEPVKVSFLTLGLPVISPPMALDEEPHSTLNTPGGTPASSAKTAMAKAERGVSLAGLATKVQPAARAGATLRAIMALGKFQGVMEATTPTGCLSTRIRLSWLGGAMMSP